MSSAQTREIMEEEFSLLLIGSLSLIETLPEHLYKKGLIFQIFFFHFPHPFYLFYFIFIFLFFFFLTFLLLLLFLRMDLLSVYTSSLRLSSSIIYSSSLHPFPSSSPPWRARGRGRGRGGDRGGRGGRFEADLEGVEVEGVEVGEVEDVLKRERERGFEDGRVFVLREKDEGRERQASKFYYIKGEEVLKGFEENKTEV